MRKKLVVSMICVLLLVGLTAPLAGRMSGELAAQKENDARIALMHEEHAAHLAAGWGDAVLPMMDIEDAWALEDGREESETPLVTMMHNGEDELGFDEASRTFYCTLGMSHEDWPELSLTACGETGVQVAWIDDYTWDWCSDAISQGYRYELIAYTDTAYEYIGMVFTGLPIVTLHAGEEIGDTYIPARVSIAADGYEALDHAALVHKRGSGFFKGIDKKSFRVEFHSLSARGRDEKTEIGILGMEPDTDWLLIGNDGDALCLSNHLAWDMWRWWQEDDWGITPLKSQMVEVFVDDEYAGLYQAMQRINEEEELVKMGGNLHTDRSARMVGGRTQTDRPVLQCYEEIEGNLELRYAPENMREGKAFDAYAPYVAMSMQEDKPGCLSDEEFTEMALKHIDIEQAMSYYLFLQACSLPMDNVYNNLYIWALWDGEKYVYQFSPWDMDSGFKRHVSEEVDKSNFNYLLMIPKRMLSLNVGNCQQVLWDVWKEKRAALLNEDVIYQWITDFADLLNYSGAYARETERWRGGAQELDITERRTYVVEHIDQIEYVMINTWPGDEQPAE